MWIRHYLSWKWKKFSFLILPLVRSYYSTSAAEVLYRHHTKGNRHYNFTSACTWRCPSCLLPERPLGRCDSTKSAKTLSKEFAWCQLMREWERPGWLPAEEWREDFSNYVCWLWLVAIIPGGELALAARFAEVVQQTLFALNIFN